MARVASLGCIGTRFLLLVAPELFNTEMLLSSSALGSTPCHSTVLAGIGKNRVHLSWSIKAAG